MTSKTIIGSLTTLPKSLHITPSTLMYLEIWPLKSVLKVVISLGPDLMYNWCKENWLELGQAQGGDPVSTQEKTTNVGDRLPQRLSFPAPTSWTSVSRTLREWISAVEATKSEVVGLTALENLNNPHFKCSFVNWSWWGLRLISILWEIPKVSGTASFHSDYKVPISES